MSLASFCHCIWLLYSCATNRFYLLRSAMVYVSKLVNCNTGANIEDFAIKRANDERTTGGRRADDGRTTGGRRSDDGRTTGGRRADVGTTPGRRRTDHVRTTGGRRTEVGRKTGGRPGCDGGGGGRTVSKTEH